MNANPSDVRPYDIDEMVRRIRESIRGFPKAAMFQLHEEGHTTVFEHLVACIVSIRTRDEVTIPAVRSLFARARTPQAVAALQVEELAALIRASTFAGSKAPRIREIAAITTGRFGGTLPCDRETLLALPGVGPKCANLVLGIACGIPHVSADIHVHRVANRWGMVSASTPEKTGEALEKLLPERYRIEINALLVPFGKHICTGASPRCSTCPVRDFCRRVGVTGHR